MLLSFLNMTQKEYFSIFLIIVFSVSIVRLLQFLLKRSLEKTYENFNEVATNFKFINNASRLIIFSIAAMLIIYTIPPLKDLGVSLFAGAGIFAVVLGLASQQAFSNVISGVFIVISKPFRVGDIIQVGESNFTKGTVEDITLRHTVITNFENHQIIIPNSVISSQTIVNSSISDPKTCVFIHVGISYSTSIDKAIGLIQNLARKHEYFVDNRTKEEKKTGIPDVIVRVINLNEFSVDLRAYVWSNTSTEGFALKCDLLKQIKEAFEREEIEIPFPYRNIVYKNESHGTD
jgi:small-conductance mechanosensitive channel